MASLPNFTRANVLVVGDVMLDSYWYGAATRISPEAPVPVVNVSRNEQRPGGAANVALNVAGLGVNTTLLGLAGKDNDGDTLLTQLAKTGVSCDITRDDSARTINKLRIISRNQQLLRLDFEQTFSSIDKSALLTSVERHLADCDLLLLSDYGKGTLSEVPTLITHAKRAGKPVLVDPKGRDFSIYHGATLLTPNVKEFEDVVGFCATEAQLFERGHNLMARLALEALLITRSADGMTLLREGLAPLHFAANAREVFDVTGAGDTVIGVLAAGLAAGASFATALRLASIAASIVVGRLGAVSVTKDELAQAVLLSSAASLEKEGVV